VQKQREGDIPRLFLRKPEISGFVGFRAETDVFVMTADEFVAEGLETC
jgi:hypothetical protein